MAEAPKQQVQIKADEKELLGQYSNLVVVHHNAEEFTLNFIYVFPTLPQGKLVAITAFSRKRGYLSTGRRLPGAGDSDSLLQHVEIADLKQYAPVMQSLSDAHGKAHLPYCVLHLCVMHIKSFVHGSAAGPGTAS